LDVGNGGAFQENGIAYTSGLFPQPVLTFSELTGRSRAVQPTPPRVALPQLPPTTVATGATTPTTAATRPPSNS
jgi:hypothetical protein